MAKNYVSNKDETARMFESDFLETFSKVHFTVPLYIYIPVIGYLFYLTIAIYSIPFFNVVGWIIVGIAVWSLTEYMLHRFLFHFKAKSNFGKRLGKHQSCVTGN